MSTTPNSSQGNRRLQTWPFRRRNIVLSGSQTGKIDRKRNHEPHYDDAAHQISLSTIFMTDSSKTVKINQQTIFEDLREISIDQKGDNTTVKYHKRNNEREENLSECPICCHHLLPPELKQMPCCSFTLCSHCLASYLITSIQLGRAKIQCPSCSEHVNASIILYDRSLPVTVRERYQRSLAQTLSKDKNTPIKLCPHCNFITILDKNDPKNGIRNHRGTSQDWIQCEQCQQNWCWSCYSPSHPNESCQNYRKTHSELNQWAKTRRIENNYQRNAQKCPKCSIYIEKIDGCDHMSCTECNSKFCYRCGSRMRLPFYIGHDAKYSIFGCKYKLWPDRPILRWLLRGSIFAGVLILTPVLLAALLSLLAVGVPTVLLIGCFGLPVFLCLECQKRA